MSQPTPGSTGTDMTFAPALMGTFRDGVTVLERGIQGINDAWNSLLSQINAFLDRVRGALEESHWWSKAVEWLTDDIADGIKKIQDAINVAQQKVSSILDTMQQTLNGSFPVMSLFQVGLDWATQVNPPLSDIAPDLSPSGAIDNWRGPAHETYKTRVADQNDAVDAVVGKVSATSNWLASVGQANTDFVTSLTSEVADLVAQLGAIGTDVAETAATDVAGVVQASNHVSEFTGETVATILKFLTSLASRLAEVLAKINELAVEYGDHTGLPGGTWPQAVNS